MKFLFTLISVFFFTAFFSQKNARITGSLSGQDKKLLEGAVVSLLSFKDLSIIKVAFTEASGQFEFDGLRTDSFKITIDLLGYKKYISDIIVIDSIRSDLNIKIELEKEENKLEEVVITTKIPFVERKIDRTIINPEALISNSGGSALDVLSKAPGVIIDENGNIKLKGKSGITVFIDDKPTYLTGTELESYLRSLPSASIKQIEIMLNPPAHYEASGGAIINIKTKKSKLKGINGSISANYAQGRYAKTSDNLSLNFTNKKISIFSNLNYGYQNNFHDLTIKRRYKNEDLSTSSVFNQNTYIHPKNDSYGIRLGLDYYVNDKTTVGISTRGLSNNSIVTKYNYAQFLNANDSLISTVIADNGQNSLFQSGSVNLNIRHQFDSAGTTLTADLDYVAYLTNTEQLYKNDVYLPDGTNSYSDIQNGALPSTINIYAFKSDYIQPLKHNDRFDAGLKTSYTQTDNDAVYLITQNNITQNNYNLSNHFKYDEMINAGYLNYTRSFKKLELQAGLRFEATILNGKQLGNVLKPYSSFNRNYNSLFPTVYISYKLDTAANNNVNLSYGKRIERPFYKDLNPFSSPLDKYTYYEGNPYLRPTFEHNVSLAYSFKEFFTTTLYYSNTLNNIQETVEIIDGIYYNRPGNIASSELASFSVEGSIPVTKWLTTNVYSELIYSHYKSKIYAETLNATGTCFFISTNNNFKFKKGWSAELSGQYITDQIDSQFSFGDYGFFNVGVQKKILKDLGSLKINMSDLLLTNRIRGTIHNLHLTDAIWYGLRDTRVLYITFSYRFGKTKNSKPKHSSTGAETEQNRVK